MKNLAKLLVGASALFFLGQQPNVPNAQQIQPLSKERTEKYLGPMYVGDSLVEVEAYKEDTCISEKSIQPLPKERTERFRLFAETGDSLTGGDGRGNDVYDNRFRRRWINYNGEKVLVSISKFNSQEGSLSVKMYGLRDKLRYSDVIFSESLDKFDGNPEKVVFCDYDNNDGDGFSVLPYGEQVELINKYQQFITHISDSLPLDSSKK